MKKQIIMNKLNAGLPACATEERMQPALQQEGTFLKVKHDAAKSAVMNTFKPGGAVAGLCVALFFLTAGLPAWAPG